MEAVLFGLNYADTPALKLDGCVRDAKQMARFLSRSYGIACTVCVDKASTTAAAMVRALYELGERSHKEDLELAWIHYSGHGIGVVDTTADEGDGQDECLVPSDYESAGPIRDDYIRSILDTFNPRTKIVCVFDCCHSGTMCDVQYSWVVGGVAQKIDRAGEHCSDRKLITLAGCQDNEVAEDTGKNGAMTACLLSALKKRPALVQNAFELVEQVASRLKAGGFKQSVKLCSSYDLTKNPSMLPPGIFQGARLTNTKS